MPFPACSTCWILDRIQGESFINHKIKGLNSMRHYEIVFLVHPDQSNQVPTMISKYESIIEQNNGVLHRLEDWGRRALAYPIEKVHKAHYVLMNIECNEQAIESMREAFKYNDSVIRNIIIRMEKSVTKPSQIMEGIKKEQQAKEEIKNTEEKEEE